MTDQDSSYETTEFQAPNVVRIIGNALRLPRGQYSRNFADVFSPSREVQHGYTNGLLSVMVSFLILVLFWGFVLCVFKFLGDEFGCAAGRPFSSASSEDDDDEVSTDDEEVSLVSSLGLFSRTDSEEKSVTKLLKKKNSSFSTNEEGERDTHPTTPEEKRAKVAGKEQIAQRRGRRTRFCFFLSGLLAYTCVPLILVLSFGPMKEAANVAHEVTEMARDVVLQVNSSFTSIESAITGAQSILQASNLSIEAICPNISNLEESIGIELTLLIDTVTMDFDSVLEDTEEKSDFVRGMIRRVQSGLNRFDSSVEEGEGWMWFIPAALFAVCIVTSMAVFGVVLAMRGKSGRNVQKTMSYIVLPLLIATTTLCWIVVLAATLGVMISSDACTASTAQGSPDDTIMQVLGVIDLDPNRTLFQLTQTYTNQCKGPNPSDEMEELQSAVQRTVDGLWQKISRIDSIGRNDILETCGGTELEDLLANSRTLAKLLTTIRRSLLSASMSISCPRINPLYLSLVHDAICTDTAAATARGFVLFIVLGICLMVMVSLRAAWLQVISKEKVYHDEMDVAENMILDEHEEYLAYISRYKHEWEEYRGFDGNELESELKENEEGWASSRDSTSAPLEDEAANMGAFFGAVDDEGSENQSHSTDGSHGFQVMIIETRETCSMDGRSPSSSQVHFELPSPIRPPPPPPPPPPQNPDFRVRRAAVRSTSHTNKSQEEGPQSFFEKYSIKHGPCIAPPVPKEVVPSSPVEIPDCAVDPPERCERGERGISFFERYGLKRGGHVTRSKSVGPSSPRPSFDPPARGPHLGRLPSGRPFFKATPAAGADDSSGGDGGAGEEVEIELKSSSLVSKEDGSQHSL